MSRESSDYN